MAERDQAVYATLIRDMPKGERPRERLRDLGPGALSTSELTAILLRTGMKGQNVLSLSSALLSRHDGIGGLARASYGELSAVKGMGDAKACQLLAAFELGRRLVSLHPEDRAVIRSPQDVFNLLEPEMAVLDQEHLRVLSLNTKNQVRGVHTVYVGNVNTSIVRVSELLRPAVRENCPSIIIVHNHPSGDPTPSAEDVLITRKVCGGAELLDIEVLDHVVIGGNGFVSMKEKGLGFSPRT